MARNTDRERTGILLVALGAFVALGCGSPSPGRAVDSSVVDSGVVDSGATDNGGGADASEPRPTGAYPYLPCNNVAFPGALRDLIQAKLSEYAHVPGVVVAFHHPDHGNVVAAFGTKDGATGPAMPVDAVFDIGSVHKLFKWVMLEKLNEAGLLAYDDAISKTTGRPVIAGATLLNLTNHSTGMVDIGQNFYDDVVKRWQGGALPHEYTYDEMMDILDTDTSAGASHGIVSGFVLGAHHRYSSYGPLVATRIAEAVTGKSALSYMRERILIDLNLTNTSFIGFDPTPAALVIGHGSDDGMSASFPKTLPPGEIPRAVSSGAGGALFSTACDMANFARDISDPAVGYLAATTIGSRTAAAIDIGGVYSVGRGVFNYHGFGAGAFWGHSGDGMSGHSSFVGYNPAIGVSAAVHANLRGSYIKNDFGLHFEILGIVEKYFAR